MEKMLIISLFTFSLWWFVNYSEVMEWFRNLIGIGTEEQNSAKWYRRLIRCSYCLGFWLGTITAFVFNYEIYSVFIGFVVAILNYFMALLEKVLIRNGL